MHDSETTLHLPRFSHRTCVLSPMWPQGKLMKLFQVGQAGEEGQRRLMIPWQVTVRSVQTCRIIPKFIVPQRPSSRIKQAPRVTAIDASEKGFAPPQTVQTGSEWTQWLTTPSAGGYGSTVVFNVQGTSCMKNWVHKDVCFAFLQHV